MLFPNSRGIKAAANLHLFTRSHLVTHYYFIITQRKSCNNDCIITCYAKRSLCYYKIITYYYVIITSGSIITHYYLFQSPELADGHRDD